ncbi:tyrosine-type DNA invertase [Serratia liquefaciens]|uniref:tyrosine-type DNA invertase n=1 Tax=Serratia liquefaciens TaxID=614 RepID=UPI0022BA09E4|nr:tyrosine-type DNA invertase [Serratia liquefaciens]
MRNLNKRKYLTEDEVKLIINTARCGKHALRNECLIQLCFIHGFRASEISLLKLSDVNVNSGVVHIKRLKGGLSTTHPLLECEKNIIEKWLNARSFWSNSASPSFFISQKGGSLSRQQIYNIIKKCGVLAGIKVPLHPHMLRHSCGFALANSGKDTRLIQDYLGHRNIQHTVIYTASNAARFFGVWDSSIF